MTSRRNVANQRSYVIIIARKEGGAWECIIINALQAVDRGEGYGGGEGHCRAFSHGGGE